MDTGHEADTTSIYSIGSGKKLVSVKSRDTYFKRRKADSSKLIIILAFLAACLFVTVIVLSILYARLTWSSNVCDTEDCVRIAASLKESMDTSVDPCEDFYKYACGRWYQEHPTPDSSLTNSWFSERTDRVSRIIRDLLRKNVTDEPWAVSQAKKLYTSCVDIESMNSLGLGPLQNLMDKLGLPKVPAVFTGETGDFIKQLGNVKKILGRDVFFGLEIFPDPRNKSRNVIYLGQPRISSPLPSDKELDKRLQQMRTRMRAVEEDPDPSAEEPPLSAERIYMTNVFTEVLRNETSKPCEKTDNLSPSDEEIGMAVDEVYEMSGSIFYMIHVETNGSSSDEDLKDEDYMLVDDLQKITDDHVKKVNDTLTPKQIWRPYLEELLDNVTDLDLGKKDKILVGDLEFLKEVALLLAGADYKTLETLLWWTVVDIVVPHSSANLRKIWSSYLAVVTDVEMTESRSLHCAVVVNQLMGMAVSWLFVDPTFHDVEGPKVSEMLENIRAVFSSLVLETDWMDKPTKMATLEKNKRMSSVIGHPKWLFYKGEIDEYYEGIDLSGDMYLDNMLQIVRLRSSHELNSLHKEIPANETYWATDPTDVNAFHTFQANQITVPAGILQFPFYELGLEALNYGAIGTILGHELTHGFDNSGRQYDSSGNLRQWWSNETIIEYTEKIRCFVDHYSKFYEKEVDDYVDGELTLGENIADNGGLREALLAYRRWIHEHGQEPLLPGFTHLTHEQLLFLSFGHLWCESYTASSLKWMLLDTHCPGHVRLRGVLENSHEFSEVWNCPIGSSMNPKRKCRLW